MSAGNGVCNTVYLTDPAVTAVDQGWALFRNYAAQGYQLAYDQITAINDFDIDFVTWDASWQADGILTGFNRPDAPELIDIDVVDLSDTVPDAPSVSIAPIVLDLAPTTPDNVANPPELNLTVNAPAAIAISRPDDAPEMDVPDAPTAPVLSFPDEPTLVEPTLPDVPTIEIVEFAEEVPEFDAAPPSETIDFVETPYTSDLLDAIEAKLTSLMAGEHLPLAVSQALFGQAMDRDDASSAKAIQEVYEEFAARGFDEPNGILAKRVLEVRQDNRNKRNDATRAIYIQDEQVAIENTRFAVGQGIQLQGTLLSAHLQIEERKFQLARAQRDVAVAVFNAHVAKYNAVINGFNARVAAYNAFVDGLKAKVEVYRAQVEAAKVEGEINEQRVRAYTAQVQAQTARAQAYGEEVNGYRARIEAEKARIDGYRGEVEAYRAYVEAYKAEWDAERTRIEAETARGAMYESVVRGFAAVVDIWKTKSQVRIEQQRGDLLTAQAFLQQHEAAVRVMLAKLEAQKVQIQAQNAQNEALARLYTAETGVEVAAVEADSRAYQALSDRERSRLEIALKDAAMQIQQVQTAQNLLLRAMESSAQASSQLAGSAFSAVNFSAGISSSAARSEACGTSFSYSGSIADA